MFNLLRSIRFKLLSFVLKCYKKNSGIFYCNERLNIGDSAVPEICKKSRVANHFSIPLKYANQLQTKGNVLFTIGSVLQWADSSSIVWGSGFISEDSKCKSLPRIYALRGSLSKIKVEKQFDIKLGSIPLCDPGLLVSKYLSFNISLQKKYKLGIIPHYADKFLFKKIVLNDKTLLLDVETSNIYDFCKQINQCEKIISSSLHGLIFSDAFSIPNAWISLSDKVLGNGFKFYDYFSSFQEDKRIKNFVEPMNLINRSIDIEFSSKSVQEIKKKQNELLQTLK